MLTPHSDLGISHAADLGGLRASIGTQQKALTPRLQTIGQSIHGSRCDIQDVKMHVDASAIALVAAVEATRWDAIGHGDSILTELQARFDALEIHLKSQHEQTAQAISIAQLPLRLLEKPSLLRGTCDTADFIQLATVPRRRATPKIKPVGCYCDLRERDRTTSGKEITRSSILGFFSKTQETSRHSPGCHLYFASQRRRSVGSRFSIAVNHTLSVLVEISLFCTTGAGGFSIGPKLNYMVLIEKSPAKDLLDLLWSNLMGAHAVQEALQVIESTELGLLELYQNRRASPHERDSNGKTHLQVSCTISSSPL